MQISEQKSISESIDGRSAQTSPEPRRLRVIEVDGSGRILSDATSTIEPGYTANLKILCHGVTMEVPTSDPVATVCEIISYLEKLA